ncbi:maleylacetoacetate isomerase [Croceibacterium ferulae]|uniref:maleylacetoacetate isomerase n=1 Tax=Croceibacterium ferulae TaxID=1854641 RepID=UPI0015882094|nr:maleylacetoacetate isomerase [Croceibacterium ferulae]
MTELVLHGYWRSGAAYRVRIALNLKGIAHRHVTHDLRLGEQRAPAYRAIAPHGLIPVIEHEGRTIIESVAILEWLEARWPALPLLPADPGDAATVRGMAALIACDIHPLHNLRVLDALRTDLAATPDQVNGWAGRWISGGFAALEALVAQHGGTYAFGDRPGLADCYLVPQLYSAQRFGVDLTPFPRLVAAGQAAAAVPEIAAAHPSRQADADG